MDDKPSTPGINNSPNHQIHQIPTPLKSEKLKFNGTIWKNPYALIFVVIFAAIGGYIIIHGFASTVSLTKVWNTNAAWSTGTLNNVAVANNSVSLASSNSSVASTTNLALNRPVVASSTNADGQSRQLPAAYVNDGNLSTRWGSAYSDPQSIYVDLGTTYNINEVKLNWETAYGKAYQIQVSNDAKTWTTIYTTTTGTGGVNDLTGLSGAGRYVRMYGTVRGTGWGYSLWEMAVYGTPAAGTSTTNLALNRPVVASSTNADGQSRQLPAAYVNDGNLSTRWGSAYSDPQSIYVDLGTTYNINEVKLNWETAYGKAYQIQVSNDAKTWTTIYTTTTGTGGVNDLTGLSGAGRYVRMYGTVRGTGWGYSLWEMAVYGTPANVTASYAPSGTITLNYDAGSAVSWTSLTPVVTLPTGTNITYQARTSPDNSTWSSWSSYSVTAKGALDLSGLASNRYIQIQASLSTTNTSATPLLSALTLGYNSTVTTPTVTLSASPATILAGQTAALSWNSVNTTSCTASGSWSGTQPTSGSVAAAPTQTSTYSIACSGTGGTANASTTVTVNIASPGTSGSTGGCTSGSNPAPCMNGSGSGTGTSGWTLKFDDEFSGNSLDTSRWKAQNNHMNNTSNLASNVTVSGGNLILTLSSSSNGAMVSSSPGDGAGSNGYNLPVGGFAEASVYFPGNGGTIDNWPAWWTSGPNWPAAGEHDIAEGLGTLTVNYHSSGSCSSNHGTVSGTWSNGFHTFGLYRASGHADVYWDGVKVKTYCTDDNGQPQSILVNIGVGQGPTVTGAPGAVKVDYVRAWQ